MMKTILHLSDFHFGSERGEVLAPLIAASRELKPDIVVVSGDLTQRARKEQFAAARQFLQQLPQPQLIVPGNHDVPLYNVFARFLRPLTNYLEFITNDLLPIYQNEMMKVVGISTARSLTWKDGRINEQQLEWLRGQFYGLSAEVIKVVVTHHPFALPDELQGSAEVVKRAALALPALQACGVDLFLAGHLHRSETGITVLSDQERGRHSLLVQAGTAVSLRERGEANSFNVIRVAPHQIIIQEFHWQSEAQRFGCAEEECFQRSAYGWESAACVAAQSRSCQ